jgi:hypothetical protein
MTLTRHQKTSKYCLDIRGAVQSEQFNCLYCSKILTTRQRLATHALSCSKNTLNIQTIKYEKDLKQKDDIIKQKDESMLELKLQISVLQDKLENIAIKGVMKSTTTTKINNKVSILTPLDLSKERLRELVEANFTNSHLLEGQKGVARFTVEHVIKDEDGKLQYICTDPARHTFRFKEGDTEIKDVRGKRLSVALAPPVMDKTSRLGMQAIKENPDLFCVYSDSQQNIRDMRDDDAEFRGELASIVG